MEGVADECELIAQDVLNYTDAAFSVEVDQALTTHTIGTMSDAGRELPVSSGAHVSPKLPLR
jgi:hypothetical protein